MSITIVKPMRSFALLNYNHGFVIIRYRMR